MVYFEIPQISHSLLSVVNWNQEIKISHTIEESRQLTNFYSDSISALTRKFESNLNIERAQQLEVDYQGLPYQDSHHYMSTTRMSDDPENGIVDEYGQIHGIPKAFCVGTSVLPVSAVNHPTYLAAALSLRTINRIALEVAESGN
jgi:choline dehydrogenase-like flavoprotein